MSKTANINLRIEPAVKAKVEAVYSNLGLSVTDALNVFIHASIMEGGFPFRPRRRDYNEETRRAISEARKIMAGEIKAKRYKNLAEVLDEIDAEDTDA